MNTFREPIEEIMSGTAFVSTTIPYVNAQPHLGHAFEYVQADAFARHLARRHEVFLLSGSDENSLKNVLAAERVGLSTGELVARNAHRFKQLIGELDIAVDRFIRTSVDRDHLRGATELWRRMERRGDLYSKDYTGLYCVGCEQFYTPAELTGGLCPEHLAAPEEVTERNWFFRLSRYGDRLLEAISSGELTIHPASRRNEVTSFVRAGLEDISVSRSVERARGWGIPVPDSRDQVMYVWAEALTNYVNALGWADDAEPYRRFWAGARRRVHVMGKGVIRFHAVYWPAILLSAGLPLPTDLVVHGYLTAGGRKISKSLGNTLDPTDLVRRYGTDAVRYFLLAEFPPFGDANFDEQRLVNRCNTDLANGLGNLVSRVSVMTVRYRGGTVPAAGPLERPEQELLAQVERSTRDSFAALDQYDHREALARIWDLVRRTNAYVDERAPWHLAKAADNGDHDAAAALDTVINLTHRAIRQLALLLRPFVPTAAARILEHLAEDPESAAADPTADLAGRTLGKAAPLFPRLELA
ncbi:methionyl-tRNA synthetase [Streptomyces sp. TLI_235]|nr:methionine--tRNA ligase [Streptomyces sp. TLI_235]PBC66218.1 methionyl-tRNA synthetase [Streptomyces sp. TLI_235]